MDVLDPVVADLHGLPYQPVYLFLASRLILGRGAQAGGSEHGHDRQPDHHWDLRSLSVHASLSFDLIRNPSGAREVERHVLSSMFGHERRDPLGLVTELESSHTSKATAMSSQRFWLSSHWLFSRVSVARVRGGRKTSLTALLAQYSKGRFGSWLGVLPTSLFVNRLQPATSENPNRVARVNASTPAARRATPWKKRVQRNALEYWYPWRSAASVRYAGQHPRSSAISVCFLRYDPSPSVWPELR